MRDSARPPSLALVDLGLPPEPHTPGQGFSLIRELLALNPLMKILVLSGQSHRDNIQYALTLGAVDFIPKPTDVNLLKARLEHQLMILDAEAQAASAVTVPCGLVGTHPVMDVLLSQVSQFALMDFPVLVEGESGSGKELVAQCLHARGPRAAEPCLTLNCAAIAADLLEAQLFGHARGAFTGAAAARSGFFEEASNGTLILDEIGEFPLDLQPKLLRVLENGEYYRLGDTRLYTSNARIIVATNRDLRDEVRAGRFREDLYHRLSVLSIHVPPLRDRGDDCLRLFDHFRDLYSARTPGFTLSQDAARRLLEYPFPGNVRELRNIVIRLTAKYPGREVDLLALEQELETGFIQIGGHQDGELDLRVAEQLESAGFSLDKVLQEWEQRYIGAAMTMSNGNLSQASRLLGINRTTLYSRLQRLRRG